MNRGYQYGDEECYRLDDKELMSISNTAVSGPIR